MKFNKPIGSFEQTEIIMPGFLSLVFEKEKGKASVKIDCVDVRDEYRCQFCS